MELLFYTVPLLINHFLAKKVTLFYLEIDYWFFGKYADKNILGDCKGN